MISLKYAMKGDEPTHKQIDTIVSHLDEAVFTGILRSAEEATKIAEGRIIESHTDTGIMRHEGMGGDPGRIRTGRMIQSLRASDGMPGQLVFTEQGSGLEVGYWNNPPRYTEKQEFAHYSISGQLLALQEMHSYLVLDLPDQVDDELDELVKQSVKGTYHPKDVEFGQPVQSSLPQFLWGDTMGLGDGSTL